MNIEDVIAKIPALDEQAMQQARLRQDDLTKPAGSLGRLESLSIHLAGITAQCPPQVRRKAVVVMAGDHGVVTEGVSAYPAEVTAQMLHNFLSGGAAISVLARTFGARVTVVDVGVAADLPHLDGLVNAKIAKGTANMAAGAAMSREQARQALQAGVQIVEKEWAQGLDLLATGEMGIGNTTPSAAIAAVVTGEKPERCVGRGTGLDDAGLRHKIEVIERALQINRPDPKDGLDVLAKVGGFEIGGLAGTMLAAAAHRVPVLLDGFISTAAALIAVLLAPGVKDFLIASHRSQERGHQIMLDWLGLKPLFDLDLRLGEGSGAALAMPLLEASCRLLAEMATFSQAGVSGKEG